VSQPARFCIRCGAAVPVADSRFCFSCGAEIVSPGLIAEQSPQPAQEPHEEPPTAPPPSSNLGTEPQGGAIDPIQAVVSGFTRCMELSRRSSRSEFWWFYLFTLCVPMLTMILDRWIGAVAFSVVVFLLLQFPTISVAVRRLHDIDRSGWWYLTLMVPIIGYVFLIACWVGPGDKGSNNYGPNPNQRSQNPR
jgi:uncharacterized membrane protein YhaH (DUF805 family)